MPPSENDSAPKNVAKQFESPSHLIHRVAQISDELFRTENTKRDITHRQFLVLQTIERQQGISQTDITMQTGIDRSTMADIVRRLADKGLIHRTHTKNDRRKYEVRLTQDGRQVVEGLIPSAQRVDERILEALPLEQRDSFLEGLRAVASRLTKSETTPS